jgi:hypothetical protein
MFCIDIFHSKKKRNFVPLCLNKDISITKCHDDKVSLKFRLCQTSKVAIFIYTILYKMNILGTGEEETGRKGMQSSVGRKTLHGSNTRQSLHCTKRRLFTCITGARKSDI